jgi:hypothetical protein
MRDEAISPPSYLPATAPPPPMRTGARLAPLSPPSAKTRTLLSRRLAVASGSAHQPPGMAHPATLHRLGASAGYHGRYRLGMNTARHIIILAVMSVPAASPLASQEVQRAISRETAVALVQRIQDADFRGDVARLQALHDSLEAFTSDRALARAAHYWRGFALWRRGLNLGIFRIHQARSAG